MISAENSITKQFDDTRLSVKKIPYRIFEIRSFLTCLFAQKFSLFLLLTVLFAHKNSMNKKRFATNYFFLKLSLQTIKYQITLFKRSATKMCV